MWLSQGLPAPGAGARNATTRPLRCDGSGSCAVPELIACPMTCGSLDQVRRPGVLVDHAAEDSPAPHRCVDRDDHIAVVVGWVLVEALAWTVVVEVTFVRVEHGASVRSL